MYEKSATRIKPRPLAGFFVCGDGGRFVSHYEKTEIH